MPSLILDFLNFNKNIDYGIVIPLAIIYIFIFWLIVSGWVYFDSRKRTRSKSRGIVIGIGNLVFGVPFLILYLLIRPSDYELEAEVESAVNGGVNVPVVNFVGKDGMVMSLELRINSAKLAHENASEMKVDVSFDSEDENKKVKEVKKNDEPEIIITQTLKGQELKTVSKSIKGRLRNIKSALTKVIKKKKQPELLKEEIKPSEKAVTITADEQLPQTTSKKSKKKNKKRR